MPRAIGASGASSDAAPRVTGTTVIDDNGDLILAIGSNDEKATFLVCSRTLSRASHVFKAMLYGSFRESSSAGVGAWVVELPDDKPAPATVLLNISHARYKPVPLSVDCRQCYDVLVFADKYDMTALLRPWIQVWANSAFPLDANLGYVPVQRPGELWCAVVLLRELAGETLLRQLVRRIIQGAALDASGEPTLDRIPVRLPGWHEMPLSEPDVVGLAMSIRKRTITGILIRLRRTVRELRAAIQSKEAVFCRVHSDGWTTSAEPPHVVCQSSSLGIIMSSLGPAELKVIMAEPGSGRVLMDAYPCSLEGTLSSTIEKVSSELDRLISSNGHSLACNPLVSINQHVCHVLKDGLKKIDLGYLVVEHMRKQRIRFGMIEIS